MTSSNNGANSRINRRKLLKSIPAAGLAGVAGCAALNGDSGSNDDFRLGFSTYQSGPYAAQGVPVVQGAQVLVDFWNDRGGVQGRDITLYTNDTGGEPDVAIRRARELVTNRDVHAIGCYLSSPEARGLIGVSDRHSVPLVQTSTGARSLVEEDCHEYAFRGGTTTISKARTGAPAAVEQYGERVFQLDPDYGWGHEIQEDWQQELERAGGESVGQAFKPFGASDFADVIPQIEEADPDWVQLGQTGSAQVAFLTQYNQQGLEYPVVVHSLHEPDVVGLSEDLIESFPLSGVQEYHYGLDNERNQEFRDLYNARYDQEPPQVAAQAFRHLDVMFQALDDGNSLEADDIVSTFRGTTQETITGEYTMRACDNQGEYPTYLSSVSEFTELGFPVWETMVETSKDDLLLPCSESGCDLPEA